MTSPPIRERFRGSPQSHEQIAYDKFAVLDQLPVLQSMAPPMAPNIGTTASPKMTAALPLQSTANRRRNMAIIPLGVDGLP
jgi:hypothetical protein